MTVSYSFMPHINIDLCLVLANGEAGEHTTVYSPLASEGKVKVPSFFD